MLESQVTLYLVHENNKEVEDVYDIILKSQDVYFIEVSLAQFSIVVVQPLVVIFLHNIILEL